MPPSKRLRAVTAEDAQAAPKTARPRPKSLAQAIEGDDYLEILVAQRREMVKDVRELTGPAKAAMHRQIALCSKEIAALQAEAKQEASESVDVADDEPFSAEAL